MAVDKRLLEMLRCPVTRQPLTPLGPEELRRLNERIAGGGLAYSGGAPVDQPLQQALVTADRTLVYRIDDDIPVMLEEQAIRLEPGNG